MSLDDIWGEPLVENPILESRPSLFLSDSDDDDMTKKTPAAPDKQRLDALFGDGEDDMFADVGAIDVEKLKRQAEANVTARRGTLPSSSAPPRPGSSPDPKGTKRREIPKLNEDRLLGDDGFPRLLKERQHFKPSGKGHEAADLEKLFRLYHGWTHKLFPKYKFRDTVERVEKLCRSRRMIVNLRVWKDEGHAMPTGNRHEDSDDSARDAQSDDEPSRSHASSRASRPSTPITRPGSVASSVPSSATDMDDMPIDALLREEEELSRDVSSYKPAEGENDEEGLLWAAAGDLVPNDGEAADDEDIWNMVDEVMQTLPQASEGANSEVGADWDDMYE